MINRFDDANIESLFGAQALTRLQNQSRGGTNGKDGSKYELFICAHRVARLARKYILTRENAVIEWQSQGFVDDVVVRRDDTLSIKAYQLKKSKSVSWSAESNKIESDFRNQEMLSRAEGYTDVRLRLVCSNEKLATTLANKMPSSIASFSKAIFFPYDAHLQLLFKDHTWLNDDFGFLSKHESPTKMDAEQVAIVLLGALTALPASAKVSEVLELARSTAPTLLRSFESDQDAYGKIWPATKVILDSILDLKYEVVRGFLSWSDASGTTTGVLSYDCFDSKFDMFQKSIARIKPKSFSEIEGELR